MKKLLVIGMLLLSAMVPAFATSTTDFMNQQGVNVHWTYDGTSYGSVNLPNALSYIGFKHIRAENSINTSATQLARLKGITDSGVKASITYFWQDPNMSVNISALESLVTYLGAGAIEAVEGQNECDGNPNNLSSYNYNGLTGFPACIQFQKDLYTAVKGDTKLSSIPYVYNFSQTFGSSQIGNTPDMSAWADVGNYHVYFSTLQASIGIDNNMPGVIGTATQRPFILTESGWTDCAESGYPYYLTRTASAPYSLTASFVALQYLVHGQPLRLTKYELLDENADAACTDHEQHFGMFDSSGNPKPIATAWHNLSTLFTDPNPTGTQISPTGTVSATNVAGSQVLTMSNGFVIALWTDAQFMNPTTHADIVPPNVTSTVQLGGTYSNVTVTDPVSGNVLATYTTPVSSIPVTFNGVAIVKVAVAPAVVTPPVVVIPPVVVTPPVVTPPTTTATKHTIVIKGSEDAFDGNATISVKLAPAAGGATTTLSSSATLTSLRFKGQTQTITYTGTWAPGNYILTINFLNDVCGDATTACTTTTDRNAFISEIAVDGVPINGGYVAMFSSGPVTFQITIP